MRYELKDFKTGCLTEQTLYSAADFPILTEMAQLQEVSFAAPISVRLRMQKLGQLVEVDGKFTTSVVLACGRCLEQYQTELSSDFAFIFTPGVAAEESDEEDYEVELEADELGLVFYQGESLDLLEPLQDQLVMALPITPLCSGACAGLCSECGCNLNQEKCQCEKKAFNNRFSTLAGLKIDSSDN